MDEGATIAQPQAEADVLSPGDDAHDHRLAATRHDEVGRLLGRLRKLLHLGQGRVQEVAHEGCAHAELEQAGRQKKGVAGLVALDVAPALQDHEHAKKLALRAAQPQADLAKRHRLAPMGQNFQDIQPLLERRGPVGHAPVGQSVPPFHQRALTSLTKRI